jgi:hypothetical protein
MADQLAVGVEKGSMECILLKGFEDVREGDAGSGNGHPMGSNMPTNEQG